MEENLQTIGEHETAPAVEEQVQEEVSQEETVKKQQMSDEQKNFVALRKAKEQAERERDEYYRKIQEFSQPQQKQDAPERELGDDDLAEGRHLKKLKAEMDSYKKQLEQTATETRIKAQFPDFDSVVTKETIEQLNTAYPELAQTIGSSSNLYNTAASAYMLIKKLGIYTDKNYDSQKEAVQRNMSKPRPLSSVSPQQGESPLSHANAFANGLTEDLKKKLYQEMIESRRSS